MWGGRLCVDSSLSHREEAADQAATIAQLRVEVESLHDERTQITDKLSDAELELTRLSERCQTARLKVNASPFLF